MDRQEKTCSTNVIRIVWCMSWRQISAKVTMRETDEQRQIGTKWLKWFKSENMQKFHTAWNERIWFVTTKQMSHNRYQASK